MIISFLRDYDFYSEDIVAKFEKYFNLLILSNKRINLISYKDESEILDVHLKDSLEFFKIHDFSNEDKIKLIDIGSGSGFPAIPIGIIMDKWHITLVESIRKKANFLSLATTIIGNSNIEVINDRAENLIKRKSFVKSYDIVTARWVAKSDVLLPLLAPFVKLNGRIILWKDPSEFERLNGFEFEIVHKYKTAKGVFKYIISIISIKDNIFGRFNVS